MIRFRSFSKAILKSFIIYPSFFFNREKTKDQRPNFGPVPKFPRLFLDIFSIYFWRKSIGFPVGTAESSVWADNLILTLENSLFRIIQNSNFKSEPKRSLQIKSLALQISNLKTWNAISRKSKRAIDPKISQIWNL